MPENHSGDSGTANMPPFPPIRPDADRPSLAEPALGQDSSRASHTEHEPAPQRDDPETQPRTGADPGFAHRARARVRHRTHKSLHRGFVNMADRLEEAAERIDRLADERLLGSPAREKAGEAAQAAAGWLDDVADYFRNADSDRLRQDLERHVRENPLRSLLIAVAAGWTIGKIVR